MTIEEFKHWFEGVVFAMGDQRPTKEQWQTIKDKFYMVDKEWGLNQTNVSNGSLNLNSPTDYNGPTNIVGVVGPYNGCEITD